MFFNSNILSKYMSIYSASEQHLNIHLYISSAWYVSTKNTNGTWGLKKTWNIFLMFCFMKVCGPFAKVIDQND